MGDSGDAARRRLIMVVDDDDDIRETLATVLEDEGLDVAPFGRAADALGALRGGLTPRAILLDLMMPVMDGAEFRRVQLADPSLAGIPVVLISAAGPEAISRDLFPRVLRKPLRIEKLMGALAEYL